MREREDGDGIPLGRQLQQRRRRRMGGVMMVLLLTQMRGRVDEGCAEADPLGHVLCVEGAGVLAEFDGGGAAGCDVAEEVDDAEAVGLDGGEELRDGGRGEEALADVRERGVHGGPRLFRRERGVRTGVEGAFAVEEEVAAERGDEAASGPRRSEEFAAGGRVERCEDVFEEDEHVEELLERGQRERGIVGMADVNVETALFVHGRRVEGVGVAFEAVEDGGCG